VQKAQHNNQFAARLGDGDGNLLVDNRPNYVWALVSLPGGQSARQVINNKTSNVYGLAVRVEQNKIGEFEVIGSDPVESTSFYTGFHVSPDTPQHGQRHGYYGDDPVIVEGLQFNPLRTRLLSSASTSVYVEDFYYKYGDETKWWPGGSIDLAAHIPDVDNKQRFVVVGLDKGINELVLTAADTITYSVSDITYVPFTGQDVKELALDTDIEPSAAVRLYYGQTSLDLRDIFFDCRHYFTPRISPSYNFPEPTILTISSGAVTVTQSTHIIAAQSGTSDYLDTITTTVDYMVLLLQADTGDTIILTENGNITLNGQDSVRFIADSEIMLFYDGTKWQLIGVVANNHVQFTALDIEDTSAVIRTQLTADGGAIFNETGAAADVRIESDTDTHNFFSWGSGNSITVGSSTKLAKFGIDGNVDETQFCVQAHSTQTNNLTEWQDSGAAVKTAINPNGSLFFGKGETTLTTNSDGALIFRTQTSGGAYPFSAFGNLVFQPRTSAARDIVFLNGSTTPTTAMVIAGLTNYVGIGTAVPENILHVRGSTGATTLKVDDLTVDASVTMTFENDAQEWLFGIRSDDKFYFRDVSGAVNVMFFDLSGNVGIGELSPTARLHVNGTADITQLLIQAHSTQSNLLSVWENSTGDDQITFSGTGGAVFNEQGNDADFRVEGDTEDHLLTVDAGDDVVRLGDWDTNYSQFAKNGDQTFVGGAGFYPRRVSQNAEPANGTGADQIDVGELIIWRDADDNQVWLMYQDTDEGIKKVELT
jgi:hypothetical protein